MGQPPSAYSRPLPRNPVKRATLYKQIHAFIHDDGAAKPCPSFARRLRSWRRGFLSESLTFYQESSYPLHLYLSDWRRYSRTARINGDWAAILDDKYLFESYFGGLVHTPRIYGVIVYGRFLPSPRNSELSSLDQLLDAHGQNGVVLKPSGGGGGREIYVLRMVGDQLEMNNKAVTREDVQNLLDGRHKTLVAEFLPQHEYARRIFPGSTNTIRMLTMIDPETQEPFLARAVHRFGSQAGIPTDNFKRGSVACQVDLDTGKLSRGAMRDARSGVVFVQEHAETGARLEGVEIPNWHDIVGQLLNVVGHLRVLPYVGWDVAVTEEGFSIIEGNSYTGVQLLQVHEPLLGDERIRRFYKHYKVI